MSEEQLPEKQLRTVRSFVIRGGRLTPSQQYALTHYWPRYGLAASDHPFNQQTVFGRQARLVLEIGFGMGDSLVAMAAAQTETDFIGIEVHPPGVGKLLDEIHKLGLSNLRIYQHDATEILARCFADDTLDVIQIFFPDPWHKKRHHKRRLIQADFVALLSRRLKRGGILHLATDWENYAEQMLAILSANPTLCNAAGQGQYSDSSRRQTTKFEQRGRRLGHEVRDLIFVKR
ncbi:MAG: tRNA (guanosine(46)-N7)-methyltransferase TrmB [Pseudomonadales bacterium]|nr:tRNA (guanosine(46)-N7)-methyltransferase TrmB [Pseudomonadales bacterium]